MNTYRFEFTPAADRKLEKLPSVVRERILGKIRSWQDSQKPLTYAKKLKGQVNQYAFRVGDYRLICAKKPNGQLVVLLVMTVGHRREVYE